MNKKNDKILIVVLTMLIFLVGSWFIGVNIFAEGQFNDLGMSQGGFYNIFNYIYSGMMREIDAIIYLFVIGGAYGVLSQTKGYRKIVDKTVKLIKGKEKIAFAIVTFLMAAYASITYELLSLFVFIPFIVTVFLRSKCDRITAISAAFGGLFIGFLGQTVGTYSFVNLFKDTSVAYTDFLWQKIVLFIIAYVLYNLFAIIHMNKSKKKDLSDKDMFCTEPLIEKNIKNKKSKTWPTAIIVGLFAIVILLAYVPWAESFGVTIFSELHTKFEDAFVLNGVPVLNAIVGNGIASFGNWNDFTYATFIIFLTTLLVAIVNKFSIKDFIDEYGKGLKKISKVVVIYVLSSSLLFFYAKHAWPATMVNSLFGNESYNMFTLLVGSVLNAAFCIEPGYSAAVYSEFLLFAFADNIIAATAMWRLGGAIAMTIIPTSTILLCGLTYMDISYKKWFKYIWKFMLSFTLLAFLFMSIVVYM